MYLIILGLFLGVGIGTFLQVDIPMEYSRYTAVAILGIMDSLFGAIRAQVDGKYDTAVFVTGLIFNMAMAILITYFGDKLNLDLYLAILVAFTIRIFMNLGIIRTNSIDRLRDRNRKKREKKLLDEQTIV